MAATRPAMSARCTRAWASWPDTSESCCAERGSPARPALATSPFLARKASAFASASATLRRRAVTVPLSAVEAERTVSARSSVSEAR